MTPPPGDPDDGGNGAPDPLALLRPRRVIEGVSAVLLPFADGAVDWSGFERLLERTVEAGLTPAVNMDTGYVNLLTTTERAEVLRVTAGVVGRDGFVAGAFVDDQPGDPFDPGAHAAALTTVAEHGGVPVVFQSHGLTSLDRDALIEAYRGFAARCSTFIAFELGPMFAPFGRIYDLDVYRQLLAIPECVGAKHSSLRRDLEWARLQLRDQTRRDFRVYTGNDLAIDMVMYGSDYLLGLSAFAPDLFGRRDRWWAAGDTRFYELNDALQYLGAFAFRDPVPAYKHTAAQFLHARGWIACPEPHPAAPRRPDSDIDVLCTLLGRLEPFEAA